MVVMVHNLFCGEITINNNNNVYHYSRNLLIGAILFCVCVLLEDI